jgi:hypothetical protein
VRRTGTPIGLITALGLAAFFLVGPAAATAGTTSLCLKDATPCTEQLATAVHLVDPEALILSSILDVECEALYSGEILSPYSASPLHIVGNLSFPNCNGGECEAKETSTSTLLSLLRTGIEKGSMTGEGQVLVKCGSFLHCVYNGKGLEATAEGPLLAGGNGLISIHKAVLNKVSGFFCPSTSELDVLYEPLEPLYISTTGSLPSKTSKTALCSADEAEETCFIENKPASVEFKDTAVEFLTGLGNFKCEGTVSGTVGEAGKPQELSAAALKYANCNNSCVVTEVSGGGKVLFLKEGSELATVTKEGFELFVKCGTTIKCLFAPAQLTGHGLGALATGDNGHLTFGKASLGKGEGLLCPAQAELDALFVASNATYIRTEYVTPKTVLCSKDEGGPTCKAENQLKTIDWKGSGVELLTNLINIKCEGLVLGAVGSPGSPLTITAELEYTGCSGGCAVTEVSGIGTINLLRESSETASATSEGFEIFVKCGTTIKCLLGPEKMTGQALGALKTGDNGHLTFSKASLGKGEGAICPSEATLDALFVAASATYIG